MLSIPASAPKFSKKILLTSIFLLVSVGTYAQSSLKTTQMTYKRVKSAYTEKWDGMKKKLETAGISASNYEVLIRVFKQEKTLEIWTKNKIDKTYTHLLDYAICESSGELGPKRQEGDGQVPEGFYTIDLFNPTSNYYLSMRVSYPNGSDAKKGKRPLGGAIMIHGNCVTIGCIPITDDKIKELYILCLESKAAGNTVKVDSYPCKLTEENITKLSASFPKETIDFWKNLKTGYDLFEKNKSRYSVSVDSKGNYVFK
ncbi:MAG: L,D-transpeptidase family protein [Bacteroidetes bacterium]|jgi:murein L,D-transpeptidase YafK|nr:L,D-transpeptidase family protein [Bacteroidota bacterium]